MRKKEKKRDDFEDDGRTVANMNIDGMPWFSPHTEKKKSEETEDNRLKLTAKESFWMVAGITGAVLLIGLVFAGAIGLFIFFCTNFWFA